MNRTPELILALDVDNIKKARYFINLLYPKIKIFKVGLQLFTNSGAESIKFIRKKGAGAFLDLKFFDIPNTVANAVREAVRLKVRMLTLHISGGEEMLKAAVKAAKDESKRLKLKPALLIGVTVLTSQKAKPGEVLSLARMGLDCGLDGVVCSAREAALLRKEIKKKFIIVTPGIRLARLHCGGAGTKTLDDQKRTATAQEAIKAGSDFLVVGRPILKAENPLKAAQEIIAECKIKEL